MLHIATFLYQFYLQNLDIRHFCGALLYYTIIYIPQTNKTIQCSEINLQICIELLKLYFIPSSSTKIIKFHSQLNKNHE